MADFSLVVRAGVPLAAGGLVYGLRSGRTILGALVARLDILPIASASRLTFIEGVRRLVPTRALDTLPDALWSFAVAQVILWIWSGERAPSRSIWLGLGFALAVGWELGQAIRLIPGTFDGADLVSSASAFALAVLIDTYRRRSPSCIR
ncbi:hypothetical protein BH11MYX4_BH11MYX4_38740 [soil metagenome]